MHDSLKEIRASLSPTPVVAGTSPAAVISGPFQLRDMTFVTIAATFQPAIVRAALPPNMHPTDEFSGGFSVLLAREGYFVAPFSAAYVWFDVQDHDGDASPCRFLYRYFNSAQPGSTLADPRAEPGLSVISEGPDHVTASIGLPGQSALRLSVRPGLTAAPLAGIDHYLMDGDATQNSSRIAVIPWAADWCDAEPSAIDLMTPDLAPLAPERLLWGAFGKKCAVTLGLSATLDQAALRPSHLTGLRLVS